MTTGHRPLGALRRALPAGSAQADTTTSGNVTWESGTNRSYTTGDAWK
ncbi:hypothetical protein [Streptomyces sp. AC550_RSS872]|nr:hypothetical protein [Streptomyces sp. AC550_RSS872]